MLGLQVGGHVPGQDAEHARLTLKLVGAESKDPQFAFSKLHSTLENVTYKTLVKTMLILDSLC